MNQAKTKLVNIFKTKAGVAKEIKDYNFRYYFVRRANEEINKLEQDHSLEVTPEMIDTQEKEVRQMKRIRTVHNSIYI